MNTFVIQEQPSTEIGIGGRGHILISQDKEDWESMGSHPLENKRWVLLRPEFVPEIIEQLQKFAEISREAIREQDEEDGSLRAMAGETQPSPTTEKPKSAKQKGAGV